MYDIRVLLITGLEQGYGGVTAYHMYRDVLKIEHGNRKTFIMRSAILLYSITPYPRRKRRNRVGKLHLED